MRHEHMSAEDMYKQALALEEDGDPSGAVSIYNKLIKLKEDPRFHIAFGACLQKLKHWEQSIAHLEKGIALKPDYCEGDARLLLAESYLNAGRKKNAIEQWKIVAEIEPEYPSYEEVPNEAKRLLAKHA